jgi:indole-3-glycerol phosphate synthase
MTMLDQLVAAAKRRVEQDKARMPVFKEASLQHPGEFPFEKALRKEGISFICEVKKASPSKGVIAEYFPYVEIARDYEGAGADAISVLTEPDFFLGADRYLREIREAVKLPLLRKDFIIDPYQIEQSRYLGADAVLLIVAILTPAQLCRYIGMATDLGLSCLVEAHDEHELQIALDAGARIIGVNNRNLKTFTVDLQNSIRLRDLAPRETVFVAESGIQSAEDIAMLREHSMNAVLVGETLMRAADKAAALKSLRRKTP